jgi:hypothetical protein
VERLETIPRATGVEEGLAARVHDPLWLLARQYQFGEFTAENAASAAWVDVEAEYHRLDSWRPESVDLVMTFDPAAEPLEKLVEQEWVFGPSPAWRADGGLRWGQQLTAAGHPELPALFAARFPLEPAPDADDPVAVVRGRLPDGATLAPALAALAEPSTRASQADALGLPAGVRDDLAALATDWLSWWGTRRKEAFEELREDSPEPAVVVGPPLAWDPHRQEHAFRVLSSTLPTVHLLASGYAGGRLDWYAFDALQVAPSPDDPGGEPTQLAARGVPAPARFGGMPLPRFWEMEDARFDPGGIDASPGDLGRLLLTAFATVYGNDWFVLPLRLPVATLSRITSFTITDVFGGTRSLTASGADVDGWNLFGLTDASASVPPGTERPTMPWFLLAPTLPNALEGPPIERVFLLRDEMANLAWAVEELAERESGVVVDRHQHWVATAPEPQPPGPFPRYRVDSVVPRHWYPLAPEQLADAESVRLRLVPLARVDEPAEAELPQGLLLAPGDDDPMGLWLFEEEVPRTGAVVERRRQHARWHDGSVHTWTTRSKRSGRGEGSSGLRFDTVEP